MKINSKSLTSLGKRVFYKNGNLKTIVIMSSKLKKVGSNTFYGIKSEGKD
ncbi:MAG: hypothetical protein HFI70_07215 [Lachnospiraceae bacterium]|nr:hypothetical protein [Lachnospiraceae bacterium]